MKELGARRAEPCTLTRMSFRVSRGLCFLLGGAVSIGVFVACGSESESTFKDPDGGSSTDGGLNDGFVFDKSDGSSLPATDAGDGTIRFVLRDFRVYNAGDTTTVADFENPPYGIGPDGGALPNYQGDWNDLDIVTTTLGADRKPVYRNPSGTTLTTHGGTAFDTWFRDVPGTNLHIEMPLVMTPLPDGSFEFDSNKSGQLNDKNNPGAGRGFFPLDDGEPYQTAFGNQGTAHNFCFTGEIHTEFTYKGSESFYFRGDDDVWVYIDGKRVIDLGGIHGPKEANVVVDSLGLTVGATYPLDFFFAERHAGGSNVLFQTTLALRAPGGVK